MTQMFAAIRRGKVKPGMAAEFAKRVREGALPAMKKMDGFKGDYLVVGADDVVIAVSLYRSRSIDTDLDAVDQRESRPAAGVTHRAIRR